MADKKETYKEKNGTTRAGDALRWIAKLGKDVAPELLQIAGEVTGVQGLIQLSNAIKKDEKLSDTDKDIVLAEIERDMVEMEEATKRLQSDNQYMITRLVRPVSFAMMFLLFLSIVLFDGNVGEFEIREAYIKVIESLFTVMTIFYFSSRGLEKITKEFKK